MVAKGMINSDNMRSLFDVVTVTLTTLTIATKPRGVSNRQQFTRLQISQELLARRILLKPIQKTKRELCYTRNLSLVVP